MGPFFVSKSILENEDAFRETFKSKIIMYLFKMQQSREGICCLEAVMRI